MENLNTIHLTWYLTQSSHPDFPKYGPYVRPYWGHCAALKARVGSLEGEIASLTATVTRLTVDKEHFRGQAEMLAKALAK